MRIRFALRVLIAGAAVTTLAYTGDAQSTFDRSPLAIARLLAAKYPAQPIMSYIPALAWSGSFRLAALTSEAQWKDKPRREMQPFIAGQTVALAEPYRLTSLAGHLAFADAGVIDGNAEAAALAKKAADVILPRAAGETIRFAIGGPRHLSAAGPRPSRPSIG